MNLGYVVAVYPEGQSIDVLMPDTGARFSNVQVMVPTGSSATGAIDLPDPGLPADDTRWDLTQNPGLYIKAVIETIRGAPICFGFIFPQISQMTFKRKNLRVIRHASDVYTTVNDNGDIEIYHPSGTYIRIGENPAHEDLTTQDFDQLWKIARNTTRQPHVHIAVAAGAAPTATVDISPTGDLVVTGNTAAVTTVGNITLNQVTIDPSGNIHSPATITGDTDVVGGGKHLKTHTHPDPQGGNVGPPN